MFMQSGEASPYPRQQFGRVTKFSDESIFDREDGRRWDETEYPALLLRLFWLLLPAFHPLRCEQLPRQEGGEDTEVRDGAVLQAPDRFAEQKPVYPP